MDIATHALASLALARGFFPRRGWAVAAGMIIAGTLADVDFVSAWFGPAAYLHWYRTCTHSIVAAIAIVAIAALVTAFLQKKSVQPHEANPTNKPPLAVSVLAVSIAAVVHLLLDLAQSHGIALFWPVRATRFAADVLPAIDPWILALLIAGVLLPEVFRLVVSEIGAKDKTPRGRNGALAALALIAVYIAGRFVLRSDAMAVLDAHSYHGESPRRLGAFPDTLSIFTWSGIVETQSLVCEVEVPVGAGRHFDAESANCLHKPEYSPVLTAAQAAKTAQEFLQVVLFPRATVEKTPDGYEVVIRAMRGVSGEESRHRVVAQIFLNGNANVLSQDLVWADEVRLR